MVVVRNIRGRKTVRWVDNLDLSPQKGKLHGCAMLRYDFLQLRLNRGVNCDSSLLGLNKLLFSHHFDISLLAGGLTALLQKV